MRYFSIFEKMQGVLNATSVDAYLHMLLNLQRQHVPLDQWTPSLGLDIDNTAHLPRPPVAAVPDPPRPPVVAVPPPPLIENSPATRTPIDATNPALIQQLLAQLKQQNVEMFGNTGNSLSHALFTTTPSSSATIGTIKISTITEKERKRKEEESRQKEREKEKEKEREKEREEERKRVREKKEKEFEALQSKGVCNKDGLYLSEFNSKAEELLGCVVRLFISETAQAAREGWVIRSMEEESCTAFTTTKVHTGRIIQRRFKETNQVWEHLVQFKRYEKRSLACHIV